MRILSVWLLALTVSAVAQTADSSDTAAQHAKKSKGEVTVQGCVSKLNTDYILMQTDPGNSYELQSSGKLHLRDYLGQQVEVAGVESPSMLTSSDFLTKAGSASPVTITISSIKTLENRCSAD